MSELLPATTKPDPDDLRICTGQPTLKDMVNLKRLAELGKQTSAIDHHNLASGRLLEAADQMAEDAAAMREYMRQCANEVDPKTGTTAWSSVAALGSTITALHKINVESVIPEQQRQFEARNQREKAGNKAKSFAPGAAVQINQTFENGKKAKTEVVVADVPDETE